MVRRSSGRFITPMPSVAKTDNPMASTEDFSQGSDATAKAVAAGADPDAEVKVQDQDQE